MSNLQSEVSVKLHIWDGRKATYEMWRNKFMINCAKKKCINRFYIKDEELPKLLDSEATKEKKTEFEEAMKPLRVMNTDLLEALVNSINHNKDEGTEALKHVFGTKTVYFPEGYASLAMRTLDKRYDNKDEIDQEELQKKFDDAKLGKKNPFDFERDMSEIRRKLAKD